MVLLDANNTPIRCFAGGGSKVRPRVDMFNKIVFINALNMCIIKAY